MAQEDTQKLDILNHLLSGKEITQLEATLKYGCTRLSGVIWYLIHKDGYDIESTRRTKTNKKGRTTSFAVYKMKEVKEND